MKILIDFFLWPESSGWQGAKSFCEGHPRISAMLVFTGPVRSSATLECFKSKQRSSAKLVWLRVYRAFPKILGPQLLARTSLAKVMWRCINGLLRIDSRFSVLSRVADTPAPLSLMFVLFRPSSLDFANARSRRITRDSQLFSAALTLWLLRGGKKILAQKSAINKQYFPLWNFFFVFMGLFGLTRA